MYSRALNRGPTFLKDSPKRKEHAWLRMSSGLLQRLLNGLKASGQLARFSEEVRGHDSQSQSDPLLSPASFVAIQKKPPLHELPVNRLPAAKDRKRHRGKKGREEESLGRGGHRR